MHCAVQCSAEKVQGDDFIYQRTILKWLKPKPFFKIKQPKAPLKPFEDTYGILSLAATSRWNRISTRSIIWKKIRSSLSLWRESVTAQPNYFHTDPFDYLYEHLWEFDHCNQK